MSGAQTSGFPNVLFNAPAAYQAAQQYQDNQLLMQQHQQTIGAGETEMAARIAGSLLTLPDEQARAAAYPTYLAQARANNYRLPHAPETYPGEAAIRVTAQMGTPSADLIKLGVDRQAKGAIAPGDDGTAGTGGTGGGGGGAGTVGGADTAPINAAGDSRTRKAGEGGPPAAGSPGAAVAKQVHDFWISKGFSEEQTAGIMAGGPGSESDFTPTVGGDKVNGVATSYGLYQHHGPRLAAMQQFFGLSGSQMPSADQQNQYAHWEITQGPLKNVGEMLKTAKTPAEAAAIWTQYFGVPADKTEIGRRARGADRYLNLYAGQPGQPGSPTAPAVVTGDLARPGDVPPPPWGAPGAYGGGGMGAVIGRPAAVSGTPIPAGRPTGPPVVTDQPAGGGVVAGPPGTAVVGAPQPPSPEVPGNVDAISRGIVARGGQPVTDPNLTPTPARYAGTAPAPSVEAAPQPGWGTGIGSGYGPQNTLAPPPPPAPARPTQPPAADTLPPLPAPTPPERRNNNGLTDAQQRDINNQRYTSISSEHLQARVDAYRAANAAAAEKYQADQIAYVREARERQSSAQAQQDRAQAQQLAREAAQRDAERLRIAQDAAQAARAKEDREAVEANKPFHGNTPDAQNRNILIDGTNSGKTDTTEYQSAYADYGTEKVDANGLKYRPDMSPYATPTGKTYGEGKGGRDLGKADVGQGPLPPPVIHTAIQGNLAGLRNVDRALRELDAHPDSVGAKGLQPDWMIQRTDPEGVKLRAEISDILSQTFHERSGAAVMVSEAARMKPFTPVQTDTAVALRTKLERIRQNYLDTLYDHYSTYGPEGGGRTMPRVEAALKDYSPTAEPANKPLSNTKIKVDLNGNVIR